MNLVDLLRSPWAIVPDRLSEIQAIYRAHIAGEKIDIDAIEARLGRPLAHEQQAYEVRDGGVAVLTMQGPIAPRANIFTQVSGGVSAQLAIKQMESMAVDTRVRGAVVAWDSPGGNVQMIPAMAKAMRALAEAKPTASVAEGTMASAAYWAGSGANAIYASGETDTIGSIGVVATHSYDPRRADRQVTEVVAGKFKRIVSDNAPLSKEGQAYMQAQVDEIYSVFVETVAQNRRASVEDVLSNMADGRVFIGRQALSAGLIDGFASVDEVVAMMADNPTKFAQRRKAVFALGVPGGMASGGTVDPRSEAPGVAPAATAVESLPAPAAQTTGPVLPVASNQPHEVHMTPTELAAKFATENPEAHALVLSVGATAERDRIKSVREQSMPGHEALVELLAMDGKTTGPQAAVAVLAAERARAAGVASARASDAPAPVDTKDAPGAGGQAPKAPARVPNAAAAFARMNSPRA